MDKAMQDDAAVATIEDEALLGMLDDYLHRRRGEDVPHGEFIRQCAARYPESDCTKRLPGLLASLDALHGFAPESNYPTSPDELHREPWADLVSQTLGDFEILSEIGRGGMGVVYRARQISLDRIVALKVLPVSVVLDRYQIARFMIEAQAAGQLNHPHIVPIYSVGQEAGVHCYSMPLIEGRTLDIVGRQSNDIRQSIRWMIQAADAIEHAHDSGVIHRDIKPSNLIVDDHGKLWVTDFGLARCRQNQSLTQSGAIVGTVRYMSPEQAIGNPSLVDHRSDIYSLGATLYEVLSGVPFGADVGESTGLSRPANWTPPPIRRRNRSVSRDLETVVMKSLAEFPNERYQSAGELSDDLQCVLDGRPVAARRPTWADRTTKWTVRHRGLVAAIGTAGLILLAISLVAASQFAKQRNELQAALVQADQNLLQAEQNLDWAESNFRQTRQVLDHFGLMAAERLRGVAGAEALREDLVRDLLTYYEGFVDDTRNQPGLQHELADTHFRAAKIIEEVGATGRALTAYQRADLLLAELPETRDRWLAIARCRNDIARLQAEMGDTEKAEAMYKQVLDDLDRSTFDFEGRPSQGQLEILAQTHASYGVLLASLDRKSEARGQFQAAINHLASSNSQEVSSTLTLAKIWNNLGHLVQDDDSEQALVFNARAVHVIETNPHDAPEIDQALATSWNNQAALLTNLGRTDEALATYEESIVLFHDLVDRFPMVVRYTEELAITYNHYGRLLHAQSRDADARQAMIQAEDLMSRLVMRLPHEKRYREALAGVQTNLSRLTP